MTDLPDIPEVLQTRELLFAKHFLQKPHPLIKSVKRLLLSSDFAARHIALLQELLAKDKCLHALGKKEYQQQLEALALQEVQMRFMQGLRDFRNEHFLRICLRELADIASTKETLATWSDCADLLINHSIAYCQHHLEKKYGQPCDPSGGLSHLVILAMGKLGGQELNLSSDIDLIFAYSLNGMTNGAERISNQEFFSKLVQQFVPLLQNITANGFVFRVDLRLRPNGDSGPLVFSFSAMETYYQEQGRDWERYAMVKARIVNDLDNSVKENFERIIRPFVYRRYVDFSVIESLRTMKAMIEREVQLDPNLNDIKRGQGGIREVEFIIQSVQLIRGGRLPQLQHQNLIKVLDILKREHLIDRSEALQKAYLFLRKLENALQALNDQQTHTVPTDPMKQIQIAYAMNYENWELLHARLQQYQRIISHAFQSVLKKVDVYEDEKRLLMNQLASVWQGHVESVMAVNLLTSLGFKNAERCYQMIYAFRHSPRCRRLTQASRIRLDRFMVLLLIRLCSTDFTDKILLQVIHLLENIVGRSAYLALLSENPPALKELLHWFSFSPFITSLLVNHPFLLEVLLDQNAVNWRLPSRKLLAEELKDKLSHCHDPELEEDILRQFKLTYWLLAARAELNKQYDCVRIGRFLTDVAESIVKALVDKACRQLKGKYPEIMKIKKRFAILAYGKSGSCEMNYTSDLDLVFLHAAKPNQENIVTRLTQKIVHMLTMRSQMGVLYAVDTRLRPSGSAGLLVSPMEAFIHYQQNSAWTWEHQALLKVRVLIGNRAMRHTFDQLKQSILNKKRDLSVLKEDVLAMRAKIDRYTNENKVKYAPGGLLDLEFLIQFLVLAYGKYAASKYTHPLTQMEKLHRENIIDKEHFKSIKKAYKLYHSLIHQNTLREITLDPRNIRLQTAALAKAMYKL